MITVDLQKLPIRAGSTILDIGCGSGRHTAAAYDLDKGLVLGADIHLHDLEQARSKLNWHAQFQKHARSRWYLAAADITRLPLKDRSVDLVICSEVLEHVPDHTKAIAECVRVLKPGKHLVISVPRRWSESVCWLLSAQYRNTKGGHLRIYHPDRLIEIVESKGTRHWATHHAHGLHTPFWWLKCLLGLNRDHLWPVAQYHRFLTWDLMDQPRITRLMERMLNPWLGKSVVLYFRKKEDAVRAE